MGLSTSVLQQLQACLVANPAQVARLQECHDDGEIAALLADLGSRAGLDLDTTELTAYIAQCRATHQAGASPEPTLELDDQRLAEIAGGAGSGSFTTWNNGVPNAARCFF